MILSLQPKKGWFRSGYEAFESFGGGCSTSPKEKGWFCLVMHLSLSFGANLYASDWGAASWSHRGGWSPPCLKPSPNPSTSLIGDSLKIGLHASSSRMDGIVESNFLGFLSLNLSFEDIGSCNRLGLLACLEDA